MRKNIVLVIGIILLLAGISMGYFYWKSGGVIDSPAVEKFVFDEKGLVKFDDWIEKQRADVHADANVANNRNANDANEDMEISFVAVGDMMLSRNVGKKMVKNGYDYPFEKITEVISSADLAFGNLESPILAGDPVNTGSFLFRADEEAAISLEKTGFDVLNLANNHVLNMGQEGLINTFAKLNENKMDYCGAGKDSTDDRILIRDVKGMKIAFLCYSYGPSEYRVTKNKAGLYINDEEDLIKDLANVKDKADFVIVSMHDGIEYEHTSSLRQQNFARSAIDYGADLVIGHHPHVVQEAEVYKGKYIFYSLGNFIFDQMWSQATREGLAVKFVIGYEGVKKIDFYPVIIEDYSQPRLVDEGERDKILDYVGLEFD
jgi:gamma-polyglutamate biosynthesis protein CapA